MTRIFTTLAAIVLLSLLTTIGFGFWSMALPKNEFYKDIYLIHFCLGLFTSLAVLLVHCIIFTYFLGTGRLVKEVAIAYKMPDEPLPKLTRELKREAFPAALFSMLIAIATAAAGAGRQLEQWHWSIHMLLAFATLGVNLWAFSVEYRCVSTNAGVMEAVMDEVDRIRAEHGLVSNAQALKEQV
ncbi:MAG TPA: hypothetical protein VE988_14595 [Gemmataceae bacterium]|nr:hypothetical protein [Gemmataceae bacterium]